MSTTKPMTLGGIKRLSGPTAEVAAQLVVYTATGQARIIDLSHYQLAQLVRDGAAIMVEAEFARLARKALDHG